ncbi:protein RGF1 INDUCIBLE TRANSCRIPTION FACTOR 1-like [Zingiber officinale]|uniref:protein RGF1 INDUCIBLE TRANSCRIPTION FACTOR 1-like n=1 Tax=Zingiber officinale TaxID=94328 RepID=UPI001C4BFDDF|nr:protein RGF1 INDUCIBLE TRANSCRIPTION FACTOR 1-like [Zingiber officinale]
MCPHCLAGRHSDHRLLQIRRYVYQDVVRVHDMANLLDCSKVQPYVVNSAKVVLLKPRRQSKPLKTNTSGPACKICRRSISDSHCYCSITCLVSDVDSPVLTVKEPTVCCQSEPLLADRPASSEDQPSPSPAASPPPFDEGQEDAGRSIPEPSVRKVHRRKGFPRRAPF